jgi:hypothetical protein
VTTAPCDDDNMSSVDSGLPPDDFSSNQGSYSNSFTSNNGDVAAGCGLMATTPSGRNSSSASVDLLRMVREEEEDDDDDEDDDDETVVLSQGRRPFVVQDADRKLLNRHELWSASVRLLCRHLTVAPSSP